MTYTKVVVDKELRERAFRIAFDPEYWDETDDEAKYVKVNDRQFGIILTDLNGEKRYIRLGAIVAELREDMTAEELMKSEIDMYNQKQADKAEKVKAKEKKIAKDKARREAEAKAKEEKANAYR